MRKIWFALAALALLGGITAAAPARADVPTPQQDDRTIGKADAPITIFEFFSLTCPHCADFEDHVYPQLKKDWIDTGKVRMIYRDYPLDQNALKAAEVARCAPPDRYAAFVQVLFQQQMVWGVQRDPTDELKKIAALGGIPADKFNQCINDDALSKSIVAEEFQAQHDYGVDSTPTFFINGKKVVGALPYDDFVAELQGQNVQVAGESTPAPTAPPSTAPAPTQAPPEASAPATTTPAAPPQVAATPDAAPAPESWYQRAWVWLKSWF